ncbi:unnamed protein product [Toxocara canis]|uniref:tRNA wybutosine-synthesizing protein 2 homolog n=1 Tax=Toxocara canis TaxID=6265 RepID=A0A183VDU1_TOXCA|nr:unnamed protein product [Toxocara canis]
MREGGLRYKLDFSKVFWNSRLSSEHDRITRKFNVHSAVFDCCAGVGPFVLPAAKRGASVVIANDLNPESVKWLQENIKINRSNIGKSEILVRCMDAREFIRTEVASRIAAEAQRSKGIDEVDKQDDDKIPNCPEIREVHLLMNLPASSLSFLPCFRGILFDRIPKGDLPFTVIVHCHLFVKAHADEEEQWYAEEAKRLVIEHLGYEKVRFKEVHFVRKVAGRKAMYCVSFELPGEVLFEEKHEDNKSEKGDNAEKNILSSSDHGNGLPDTRKDGSPPPLKIARIEPIGECLR